MKAVFVQRDEKSAKAKGAEVVRQFQHRYAKAMEIFKARRRAELPALSSGD